MCRLGLEAEADNSNQSSEGGFRVTKSNKMRKLHSQDPGMFLVYVWREMKLQCKQWVEQLETIEQIVGKSNTRMRKRVMMSLTEAQQCDFMEDQSDILFFKKRKVVASLATDFLEVIGSMKQSIPVESDRDKYNALKEHCLEHEVDIMGFVAFKNWIHGTKKSRLSDDLLNCISLYVDKYKSQVKIPMKSEEDGVKDNDERDNSRHDPVLAVPEAILNKVINVLEGSGELPLVIRKKRLEFSILADPHHRKIPIKYSRLIKDYCSAVVSDPNLHNDSACYWDHDNPVKLDQVPEIELNAMELRRDSREAGCGSDG